MSPLQLPPGIASSIMLRIPLFSQDYTSPISHFLHKNAAQYLNLSGSSRFYISGVCK